MWLKKLFLIPKKDMVFQYLMVNAEYPINVNTLQRVQNTTIRIVQGKRIYGKVKTAIKNFNILKYQPDGY